MTTFQQFREGMQSDEIEEKLKFVKQLLDVAKEMGKEETISTLIPFLNGKIVEFLSFCRLVSR